MSDAGGTCEYVLDPDDPDTRGSRRWVYDGNVNDKNIMKDGKWTCPHDAQGEKDFCIFHLPLSEKDEKETVNSLIDILQEFEDIDDIGLKRRKFQFIGSIFGDVNLAPSSDSNSGSICELFGSSTTDDEQVNEGNNDISNIETEVPVDLRDAEFDDFACPQAIINNDFDFRGAKFTGSTSFIGAEINKRLNFREALFYGDAWFTNCTFIKHPTYQNTEFECEVRFNDSKFIEQPNFLSASFMNLSLFNNVVFENMADFWGAKFEKRTSFDGTTFEDSVRFNECVFSEEVTYRGVEFSGKVRFEEAIFDGGVNFRNARFNSDSIFTHTHYNGEISFESVESIGNLIFADVDLSGSSFKDANIQEVQFEKTNLTDSDFSYSVVQSGKFERALLSRCDFFGTKLQGAAFYGAVFGDAQINEETEFGDRCVYDPDFNDAPAADIDDDETGRLTKAAGQYRIIEKLARENAFPDMVSHNFIRRQDIHREQHWQEGRWGRWLRATASKYVLEYGENPWRLIATGLIIVGTFGVLYPLVGGLQPTNGPTITLSRTLDNPILLLQSIYYSTLTFTTLGMGDFLPVGLGRVLTTIETSLGAIIIALLVFVFGRRAAR